MKKFVKILILIPLGILAVAAFGWVTMSLWNWLVPQLFNGPSITFWQALGLLVLSKILFSGIGKGGGSHHHHWKRKWKNRLETMSPEDRERFRQKMKDKWCGYAKPASEPKPDTSNG